MCVAIVVPVPEEGKTHTPLTLDELKACEKANSAGGGISFLTKKGIYFKKGISAEEIFELQKEAKPPYQIHFRIPTVGGSDKRLCHPFPITKDASLALEGTCRTAMLVHNGHWSEWRRGLLNLLQGPMPAGPWTDTRGMVYVVAHFGPETLLLVDEKVSVLFADGSVRYWGAWHNHNGNYFSNMIWQNHMPRPVSEIVSSGGSGMAANRSHYTSGDGDIEIDLYTKDDRDISLIAEWGKWVGLKAASLNAAIAAVRARSSGATTETALDPVRNKEEDQKTIKELLARPGTVMLK